MATRGGSQCGYCTPGFICSMAAEYYRAGRGQEHHPAGASADGQAADPEPAECRHGRRARCQRFRSARAERQPVPLHRLPADQGRRLRARRAGTPMTFSRPGAARHRRSRARPGSTAETAEFVRPADLAEALQLLAERPEAVLVAGSTDWGVEVNIRGRPSAARGRDRPAPGAARAEHRPTTRSGSAPR